MVFGLGSHRHQTEEEKRRLAGEWVYDTVRCVDSDPNACAGKLEGNPIRQDIEEAGQIAGLHYMVNVVLDEHKHIVYAVAGDVTAAHREGCRYLDRMYRKDIPAQADIVLVSQGGAPKDANLYQTQKALDNAKYAVKKGGTIILMGACNEGMGSKTFQDWFQAAPTAQSMITRIHQDFQLGVIRLRRWQWYWKMPISTWCRKWSRILCGAYS